MDAEKIEEIKEAIKKSDFCLPPKEMKGAYDIGYEDALSEVEEKLPKIKCAGGDTMDDDECDRRRGWNSYRSEVIKLLKELKI